jgi:hypothetical protein
MTCFPEYFTQNGPGSEATLLVIGLNFLKVSTANLRGLYPFNAAGSVRINYHLTAVSTASIKPSLVGIY